MTVLRMSRDPKTFSVMPAKKVVYKAMIAMPAILLIGLGIKTHVEYDSFEFAAATPKLNSQILAYKDVVAATQKMSDPFARDLDPRFVRSLARLWVTGQKSGRLVALEPVSYDDNCRDGLKGEIMQANQRLSTSLNYISGLELEKKQYAASALDAMLAMKVVDTLKYSDYPTLVTGSLTQRRSLRLISATLPNLNGPDRDCVVSFLRVNKPKMQSYEHVASLEHLLFVEYLRRMDIEPTKIESERPLTATGGEVANGQVVGTLLASARDDTVPQGQQLERIAREGELDLVKSMDQVVKSAERHTTAL